MQPKPEIQQFTDKDVSEGIKRILADFAQHPELAKLLDKPALSFSRKKAQDLVSRQLKALEYLTPQSGLPTDLFDKCIKNTKKAHELCNNCLDASEHAVRWPSLYTPDPKRGHEVLISAWALERLKKRLDVSVDTASTLKDATLRLGQLRLEWVAKRSSETENFDDYVKKAVPELRDDLGTALSLLLIENECDDVARALKQTTILLNLSMILRYLFYQGIIRGQGGAFSRDERLERAHKVGIDTIVTAAAPVLGVFGHLAEAIKLLGEWSGVFDDAGKLIKARIQAEKFHKYITSYDQAVSIWANIVVPINNLIRIYLEALVGASSAQPLSNTSQSETGSVLPAAR